MSNAAITTCSGTFYDSGSFVGSYQNNEDFSTTICSDGSQGSHINLIFSNIDLSPGDLLCFYDGNGNNAPQISCILDFSFSGPLVVQASPENLSGCITVTFNSNNISVGTGWTAEILCSEACQPVIANLDATTPLAEPADNGWIDICPGDEVTFTASGEYPNNGLNYQQSDNTSTFTWDFGDGTFGTGSTVTHQFIEPGGYMVQLLIEDINGCRNFNFIEQRVRVAPPPTIDIVGDIPDQLCVGEVLMVNSDLDASDSDIVVTPQQASFTTLPVYSDTLYVPDGLSSYSTSVQLSQFEPGQVLTNVDDLLGICFNMEHSYLHDLEIFITCPSGNTVILQDHVGLIPEKILLGEPIQDLDVPCDSSDDTPGVGYDYCFMDFTPNGTMTAASFSVMEGESLPAGNYTSFESLSGLLGCPLNGEWTITVADSLVCDDGWVFSWNIDFDETLYPEVEEFAPQIASWNWEDDINVSNAVPDFMISQLEAAGLAQYSFEITDEFGCEYDTIIAVNVLPAMHPACFTCENELEDISDITICQGDSSNLEIVYDGELEYIESFRATPKEAINSVNYPPSNPFISKINVTNVFPTSISTTQVEIASICINYQTDVTQDILLELQAPSGQRLRLFANHGGLDDNLVNTCFEPNATESIETASPPFTGSFQPTGNWNTLTGADINGIWSLYFSDAAGTTMGYIQDWTITFNIQNELTYTWSNASTLSCSDCSNPMASPETTTTYEVQVEDLYNCALTQEVTVNVISVLETIDLVITDMQGGTVFFSWDASPSAAGYQVNINNMGWQDVGLVTSSQATGFQVDDPITIQVMPYSDPPVCEHPTDEVSAIYSNCFLAVNEGIFSDPSCTGLNDGIASIEVLNGEVPYSYSIDNEAPQTVSIFQNLTAGTYTLYATDNRGCIDSVTIVLEDPPLLEVNTSATPTTCFETMDGMLEATASGGVGDYSYAWSIQNTTTATVDNVAAGMYEVVVTDEKNCTAMAIQEVQEPDELQVNVIINPTSCYGGSDGSAMALVSGGTPDYIYQWTGGADSPSFDNVSADTYFLTVTDGNGCSNISFVAIEEPTPAVATIATTPINCHNGSDGAATVELSGNAPHTFLWSDENFSTNQTLADLAAGNYSVTMTDADGCQSIGITTLENPVEITAIASSEPTLCVGSDDGTATVVAVGGTENYTYTWSDSDLQITDIATNLEPGVYDVTVSDSNNCTLTASTMVEEAQAISLSIEVVPTSCEANSDGSATAVAIGGAENFEYSWNDTNNQISNIATDLNNGTYTVTVTDANNCTASSSTEIVSDDPIMIDTLTTVMVSCFGENDGEANLFASGGVGEYSYVWSDPNMQIANPAIDLVAGTYSVTITDESNCSQVSSIEITEPSILEANVSAEMVNCFGEETGSAMIVPSGGMQPYTYLWNDTNNQADSIAQNLSQGTYQVTLSDFNGCTMTESVAITQPESPIFTFLNQTFAGCTDEGTNEAELEISGGNAIIYDIEWSNNDTGLTATNLQAGINYVTVTDASDCVVIDSIEIQDLAPIEANIAFAQPSCYNYLDGQIAVNFIEGGAGQSALSNYDYQWSTSPVQTGPVASGLAGDQTYFVTVTDTQGCQTIDSVMVTQPVLMQVNTNTLDVTCFGENDGSIEVINVLANTFEFEYAWSENTGNQTGESADSLTAGTYTLTVTDENGCSLVTPIFITEPNPVSINLEIQDNSCHGAAEGTAIASASGGISPYSYFWSNKVGTNNISNLEAGNYFLTVLDANGCAFSDSVLITEPSPILANVAIDPLDCVGDTDAALSVSSQGGQAPYTYALNDDDFKSNSEFIGLGQGDYDLQVQDDNGCIWDTTFMIQMPEAFELLAQDNVIIQVGDSVQLSSDYTNASGMPIFEWSSQEGVGLSCQICPNPMVAPLETTIYEVNAIDENGCAASDFIRVVVERNAEVLVPTGFTPNGDGTNDLLYVHGKSKSIDEISLFQIYDRWGEMVYENRNFAINDLTVGWDGTLRNQDLPSGVFVWYLEVLFLDGQSKSYQGHTTLIR